MRRISAAELSKLQNDGATIKLKKKAARKEPAKPAPAAPAPVDLSQVVESINQAAEKTAESSNRNTMAILALQRKLIEQDKPPVPYKFTINRDAYGDLESVDAVPGKV